MSSARAQTFQTFSYGDLGPFQVMCLKSFADHGHRVIVHAYDHATTPEFCARADAAELIPRSRVFCYRDGFGAGSVSAFSNLFRYMLLQRDGGWWIDTDVVCLTAD